MYGLTREEVIRRVEKSDGVYSVLFEQLEKVSGGDVIKNQPTLYVDNERIDEMHYLHVTYPILLRVEVKAENYEKKNTYDEKEEKCKPK
jgi:hypothetical protein